MGQARVHKTDARMGQDGRQAQGQREEADYERREVMAVYRPKRKGEASKYYICEFVYLGKRFQESTGATSKTVAKEYEKNRRKELERAAAGLPTEQKAARIGTVNDVPEHFLFPWGKPVPSNPMRHAIDITWGWDQLRADRASNAAFTIFGIPLLLGLP